MNRGKMMRNVIILSVLLFGASVYAVNMSDDILLYRPAPPAGAGEWYAFDPDGVGGEWIDGVVDQQVGWGWETIVDAFVADFNGDGFDDKVLVQAPGNQWQIITTYTYTDGSIASTDFTNEGDILVDWWDNTEQSLLFGDVDGDGISDSGITTSGAFSFGYTPGVDPEADWLVWRAYCSQGIEGIPMLINPVDPNNWTGDNVFGVYSEDTPMFGDINGDGIDDRVNYRASTGLIYVDYGVQFINPHLRTDPNYNGFGDSIIDSMATFGGTAGDDLAISDINGDGYDDVVVVRNMREVPGWSDPNDYYALFGYYSSASGLSTNDPASPDITANVGTPSLGDKVLFGDISPFFLRGDFDGDADVDTDDLSDLGYNWLLDTATIPEPTAANGGFEYPVVADGTSTYGTLPNAWWGSSFPELLDTINPADVDPVQPNEGDNYVYMNAGFDGMNQWIGYTILPDTLYVVSADIKADPVDPSMWYQISLTANTGTHLAPVWKGVITSATHNTNPADNNWNPVVAVFDSADPAYQQYVGDLLMVQVAGSNAAVDNVVFSHDRLGLSNGSFEDPPMSVGDDTAHVYVGGPGNDLFDWGNWLPTLSDAEIRDPNTASTLQANDGDNYLFIGTGGSAVTQLIDPNVAPGMIYRVTAAVGTESASLFGWYWISFYTVDDEGVWTNQIVGVNHGNVAPVTDGWVNIEFEMDTSTYAGAVDTSLQLFLEGTNVAYDNVVVEVVSKYDLNQDGIVDLQDYAMFAEKWMYAF